MKRYRFDDDCYPGEHSDGDYVSFAEAQARIAELEELNEKLADGLRACNRNFLRADQDAQRLDWLLTAASDNQIEPIFGCAYKGSAIAMIDSAMEGEK